MEKTKFIAAVNLILIQDNKILLSRRYNTGFEDGNYSVIAGHMEANESVAGAMSRESMEEAGIMIKPQELQVVHTMHRLTSNGDSFNFFLTTNKWSGEPKIMESDKCDDLSWFPINALPPNLVPYIKSGLENYVKNNTFSEFDKYT